ncbi:hypothetical protein T484DRAFT_1910958 [Baffinella frigidus]|nr:hypothetical protein T484DRAFT_1910958 [Cryptophyta sp. CCMP2293]
MFVRTALLVAVSVPGAIAFSLLPGSAGLQARQLRAHSTNSVRDTVMSAEGGSVGRRQLLAGAAALGVQGAFQAPAWAEPAVYKNSERGFTFTPPEGWTEAVGEFPNAARSPARPTIVSWISPQQQEVNLALVSYSIRPDYGKLGRVHVLVSYSIRPDYGKLRSLGNIDSVANTIIGMGQGEGVPLDAEMYQQTEKGNAYYFDYRIKDKHLRTVFAIQEQSPSGTWLVTLTAQPAVWYGLAIQEQSPSGTWLVTMTTQAPNTKVYDEDKEAAPNTKVYDENKEAAPNTKVYDENKEAAPNTKVYDENKDVFVKAIDSFKLLKD